MNINYTLLGDSAKVKVDTRTVSELLNDAASKQELDELCAMADAKLKLKQHLEAGVPERRLLDVWC